MRAPTRVGATLLIVAVASLVGCSSSKPDEAPAPAPTMQVAAGTGASQVGGPVDLDGGGSQYFSDDTHSDHVHVGFDQ